MDKEHNYTAQVHLNTIAITRLLFCKEEELLTAMGYSEHTKNIGRIGGNNQFMKEAIIACLDAKYAKLISPEIDLRSVLQDYMAASAYVSKFHRHKYFKRKSNEDNYAALMEHFCVGVTDCSDSQFHVDTNLMEQGYKNEGIPPVDLSSYILPIMLLIFWGIIPAYNPKKSCDVKNINSDAEQMFRMVEAAIGKSNGILRRYPIIDRLRNELQHCTSPNRLWLIHSLGCILDVFNANSCPENQIDTMDEISWVKLDINGYWEDIAAKDDYTIWHFQSDDDCFYTVRQLMKDHNNIFYRTYDMYLTYSEYSDAIAMVLPTEGFRGLISDGAIADDMQFMATVDISSGQSAADEMELTCCSENDWFTSRKLRRITDEAKGKNLFNNAKSWIYNVDYKLVDHAYAVTADHIYFRKPGTGLFYKIPRVEEFQNTDIYALSMFESKDYLYAGCPLTLKYVDLTDDNNLESKGVEIVDRIV